MYYKPITFSPLDGEVTAKATRTLQVSPGFGEFFINVCAQSGWSCTPKDTGGLDHFGKRLPLVSSYPTKNNEHQKPCGEALLPCGKTASNSLWIQHWRGGKADTEQHITFSLLCRGLNTGLPGGVVEPHPLETLQNHLDIIQVDKDDPAWTGYCNTWPHYPFQPEPVTGQENLLAINTFLGGQGQSWFRTCFPNTTWVFITPVTVPYICLSTTGSVVLFNFQTNFLGIWTISHLKKWSCTSKTVGQWLYKPLK